MRVGGELKDRVPPGLTGERHIFISRTAGLGPKGWTEVLQMDRWAGEMCGLRAPHSLGKAHEGELGAWRGRNAPLGLE